MSGTGDNAYGVPNLRLTPVAIVLVYLLVNTGNAAVARTQVFDYIVKLATFGQVGSYQNRIEQVGDVVTVTSRLRCAVKFLGMVVHREDADRIEQWQGGRLTYFDGVTTTNGDSVRVHGERHGDQFVVTSPKGVVTAPANLFPSNPWSTSFINAHTILHVSDGIVEEAKVTTDGKEQALTIAGKPVRALPYRIESPLTHAVVWVDQQNRLVLMEGDAHDHVVTVELASETAK